ncbi:MAG TPA: hypothetical protein VKG38_20200, partial [Solirubrobacteraceae bacterium]|nr:hypothetical protein [Solirubrobacteraceae bacterium]
MTWERRCDEPDILFITNVWPHPEKPAYGTFIKASVEGLEAVGVRADVLFIRGYSGKIAYAVGALLVTALGMTRGRYTLVHSQGGETALVARLYMRAPVIASYLGSDLLAPNEGDWRLRAKCRVQSAAIRTHAVLMAATSTKSHEMESVLPRRAQRRNSVIRDGIDLDKFVPSDRETARKRLGWRLGARIVLFAG